MGIINRLLGGKNGAETPSPPAEAPVREGIPIGMNTENAVLTVTPGAQEKIAQILGSQNPPATTIRVSSAYRGKYAMNLEPDGSPKMDDTVLPYNGFQVFVDAQSLPNVEGAQLDYLETYGGGGFQFTNPNEPAARAKKEPPEGPEGDFFRSVQQVLDEEVNPAVASHGGYIDLMDVQGSTVYVKMGGGCQGCGSAQATLKQGVERILKDHFPEIEEILDVTDHAGGRNPYYAAR